MSNERVYTIKRAAERPSSMRDFKVHFADVCFSKTQVQILEKMGEGFQNLQIAEELNISRRTVESHIFNMKLMLAKHFGYKFGDRELVIFAYKMLEDYKDYIKTNLVNFSELCLNTILEESFMEIFEEFNKEEHQELFEINKKSVDFNHINPSLDKWTSQKNGF